jgi:hypothetical protein
LFMLDYISYFDFTPSQLDASSTLNSIVLLIDKS